MKKVGILTTFYSWNKSYSLTSVVEEQLLSFIENGYRPVLFVHDNFEGEVPKGIEVRKIVPRFNLIDYSGHQEIKDDFWKEAKVATEAFEKHFADIDFMLCHDIIFQGWFLTYNVAIREAAKKLKCKWFHWTHSAPSDRPLDMEVPHSYRYSLPINSKLVYMNHYDALKLAEMYGTKLDNVRVIYNPLDLRSFFNVSEFTNKLVKKYKILEADIIVVYPVSSTRFDAKQVKKVIKLAAKLKNNERSVRFICVNAHANGQAEKDNIENYLMYAEEEGLTRKEVIFTSLEDKKYEVELPHEIVRELFIFSNVFIFPSISENCPLILMEAAASKCLLVLNESFPPMREFFDENAIYFKFGSSREKVKYNDEENYFNDVAKVIIGQLNVNKPLKAFTKLKQRFNRDWIFKNQLEPMLYEDDRPVN